MRKATVFVFLAALLALAACSKSADVQPTDSQAGTVVDGPGSAQSGLDGDGIRQGEEFGGMDLAARDALANTIVLFDYDSTDIKLEYEEMLAAHARHLVENPSRRVRLEGHADERGSREYNIGLGERRAQSVRRVLMLQGADGSQIVTVSFGEERPAAFGSTDEAWAQNRRVELVY